jgi:hypothetical protein
MNIIRGAIQIIGEGKALQNWKIFFKALSKPLWK